MYKVWLVTDRVNRVGCGLPVDIFLAIWLTTLDPVMDDPGSSAPSVLGNEPRSESPVNEPTSETPLGELPAETPMNIPRSEPPVNEPPSETQVDKPHTKASADEASTAPVDESAYDVGRSEPKSEAPVDEQQTGAQLDEPPSEASGKDLPPDAAPAVPENAAAQVTTTGAVPSPPSVPSSSSLTSVSGDSGAEEPLPADPADPGDLSELADPLVYDATRATVTTVLGHAAELLQAGELRATPSQLSAAVELLRRVLSAACRQLEAASASVHRLLPLGLRLAEYVMTVPQWRAVEARSRRCARRAIYQALLELQLPREQQEARQLLRALRRRPARLWADISLDEAAAELATRRPPDRYPGFDQARDAGREVETALLAAYRAAARARLTEPVPAVPLPPAAGLDNAARVAVVHEVVKSWSYSIRWRYCVDFLRTEEEPLLSRHIYQVRFSMPEPHQPIPRAVAYVFFVLTVSKARRSSEPIKMYYMMETSRLKHVPGKVVFQEKWLIDIINFKLKFWREIMF